MATALVKRARQRTIRPIVIGDGSQIHWSEIFDGNPNISREITPDCVWVKAYPGRRDYQRRIHEDRIEWNDAFHADPGEIYLTDEERGFPDRSFVYIEPNVKGTVNPNKDWGFDNWQKVVDALPGIHFVQGSGRRLERVSQRDTRSFRYACGLLSHACLFVGTDGGLHHAAAALGVRAVVVWGGLVSPKILGYADHLNLCRAQTFCGSQKKCGHCEEALGRITPDYVAQGILRFIDQASHV